MPSSAILNQELLWKKAGQLKGRSRLAVRRRITIYRRILNTVSRSNNPRAWATAHLLLAGAYDDSLQGQPSQNVQYALEHLRRAETFFTRRKAPKVWAAIQEMRGLLLPHHPRLSKVRRLLLAIRYEQRALRQIGRRSDPSYWAEIQWNLGCSYEVLFRTRYEPQDLEIAYRHFRNASTVFKSSNLRRVSDRKDARNKLITIRRVLRSTAFKKLKRLKNRSTRRA